MIMTALKKVDTSCLGLGIRELEVIQDAMAGAETEEAVLNQETVIDALADKNEDYFSELVKAYLDNDNAEIGRYLVVAINDYLIEWAEKARQRDRQLIIKTRTE